MALNNIFACYDNIEKDSKSSGCLVPIIKSSSSNRIGNFTDGTLQQLKNAGGFRLLNKSDKDSIVAYDHAARAFQNFESTIFQQRQDIVRDIYVKLIDFKAEPIVAPDSLAGNVHLPLLFSNDKALINEYFNDLSLYRRVIRTQISQLGKLSKRAVGLIKYFDNKYELGDEWEAKKFGSRKSDEKNQKPGARSQDARRRKQLPAAQTGAFDNLQ